MNATDDASPMGEDAIIQGYLAPLAAGFAGAYGLHDDCATIAPPPGTELVVKTDPVRAGVHFFADDTPEDIAWKALAVNVSDLAAKGATPIGYLLAVSFPRAPDHDWLRRFASGLAAAQSAFGCHLIGGDTDRAEGPMSLAVTVFGSVPIGRMVRRATARVGHAVLVSGTIGDGALGLAVRRGDGDVSLNDADRATLLDRYLRPSPRLALRETLLRHAGAAMDVSDGLVKDLDRMCRASGVGARVALANVPLSAGARRVSAGKADVLARLVAHGDDYEILCTVPEADVDATRAMACAAGVPLTRIGTIVAGAGVTWTGPDGAPLTWQRPGYDHF